MGRRKAKPTGNSSKEKPLWFDELSMRKAESMAKARAFTIVSVTDAVLLLNDVIRAFFRDDTHSKIKR